MRGFKGRGRGRGGPRKEKYRVNQAINAPEVRLVDDEGQMVGVMSSRDALRIAEDKGLDLIEIAPNAKPPTCKIMDYGKYKYEAKKKEKAAKKKQNIISVKEVQLRPRTDEHDLAVKAKHARRFLLEGDKVKVNLRFLGREMAHQDLGLELLKKFASDLEDIANVEAPPKMEGRQMFVLLAPDAAKVKEYKKANKDHDKESESAEKAEDAKSQQAEQ